MKLFATDSMAHVIFSNCVGPVELKDAQAAGRDVSNLQAALASSGLKASDAFIGAVSPGQIAFNYPNQYYGSHEEYLHALAHLLHHDYKAVTDAGFSLQIDSPDLAMAGHCRSVGSSVPADWAKHLPAAIEALNHALEGIPAEQVRLHLCWGNYGGPHHKDVPLRDIIEPVLKANVGTIYPEGGNPRHEHEWRVFQGGAKAPRRQGRDSSASSSTSSRNFVEHPPLVADRLVRLANALSASERRDRCHGLRLRHLHPVSRSCRPGGGVAKARVARPRRGARIRRALVKLRPSRELGARRGQQQRLLLSFEWSGPCLIAANSSETLGAHQLPSRCALGSIDRCSRCARFEKRANDLFLQGLEGHEPSWQRARGDSCGLRQAMRPGDYSFATYRGHNHTLSRGVPMAPVMSELMGRAGGLMGGKGGSMHLTSVEHGMLGCYAIVGAHLTIANGAAFSAKYRHSDAVTVCFFGDGATNIGAFHEALNLAAVWKLPIVFVCENNLYMEYTPIAAAIAVEHPAADRAAAYGLEPIIVDAVTTQTRCSRSPRSPSSVFARAKVRASSRR